MDNWCGSTMCCTTHNLFSAYQTLDFESFLGSQTFKQLTWTLCEVSSSLSKTIQALYYPYTHVHFYHHIILNKYSITVLHIKFEHRLLSNYLIAINTCVQLVDAIPNHTVKKPIPRLKTHFWSSFLTRNLENSATIYHLQKALIIKSEIILYLDNIFSSHGSQNDWV